MKEVDKQTCLTYIKRRKATPLQVTSNILVYKAKGKVIAHVSFLHGTTYYIRTRTHYNESL
jgi:hypothetical protein